MRTCPICKICLGSRKGARRHFKMQHGGCHVPPAGPRRTTQEDNGDSSSSEGSQEGPRGNTGGTRCADPPLPGEQVRGAGTSTGWTTVEVRPGQLVSWTRSTNFYITAPAVLSGVEVPSWWPDSLVRRHLGIQTGDLQRMESCITREVEQQRDQAARARRVYQERPEPLVEEIIIIDDDEGMDI